MSELDNQAGRLKNAEINTDRPGFSSSSGPGPGGHSMTPAETAHDHVAANFAREIAELLQRGRNEQRFNQIVLVAEPRFLGMMRGTLDNGTLNMVRGTVGKDLAHVAFHDLGRHLEGVLAI